MKRLDEGRRSALRVALQGLQDELDEALLNGAQKQGNHPE